MFVGLKKKHYFCLNLATHIFKIFIKPKTYSLNAKNQSICTSDYVVGPWEMPKGIEPQEFVGGG